MRRPPQPRHVSGWVFDPAVGDGKMQVRVTLGDRVLAEGAADLPRPEVGKLLGTAGDHGFRFAAVDFPSRAVEQVIVQARPSP